MSNMSNIPKPLYLVWVIPIVMLLLAPFGWPYTYYNILRIVTTLSSCYVAYREYDDSSLGWWSVLFIGIAILYNPIAPVHLTKATWVYINIAVAVTYIINLASHKKFKGGECFMHDDEYNIKKEEVFNDIKRFHTRSKIYHAFHENFFSQEFLRKLDSRSPNILYVISQSILIDLYLTLRRILSIWHRKEREDNSLPHLYKEVFNDKRSGDELVKACLPETSEIYEMMNKYINKKVAHNDPDIVHEVEFQWQDIYKVFNELKETFDNITLKQEKATYSFDAKDVECLSDKLFKDIVRSFPSRD